MKRKKGLPDSLKTIEVSEEMKNVIVSLSQRWGIPVCDFVEIVCRNVLLKEVIYSLHCENCGAENWRDESGLFPVMYAVEEGRCSACGNVF